VLIRSFAEEVSPLTPVKLNPEWSELEEPKQPGPTESSAWRRMGDHYITHTLNR
jgi:hypothetical protein